MMILFAPKVLIAMMTPADIYLANKTQISRLKVGWVAPCVGIGGADAHMLALCKNFINIETTGIAIADATSKNQILWLQSYLDKPINLHQIENNSPNFDGWTYHKTMEDAVFAATYNADIIVQWGVKGARDLYHAIDKPIVELAQNEDEFAKEIVKDNKTFVNYRIAVSRAAATIFDGACDRIIYNGIDPTRCTPRLGRDACRQAWGFDNRKVILFMGRYVDEKHPADIIACLKHLPPEWCVLYVGRGYRQDDLIKEAQRHLGGDRVFFAESQYHVGDLLSACDVYCLPSDFEGHPLALAEAWLAGIPTVVYDFNVINEIHELVGAPITNVVPKTCEPLQLAHAILNADNPEMVSRAHQVAWQNFTIATIAYQWEEALFDFFYDWHKKRRTMRLYKTPDKKPLSTSKAHIKMVDTSQDSIAKWDKYK